MSPSVRGVAAVALLALGAVPIAAYRMRADDRPERGSLARSARTDAELDVPLPVRVAPVVRAPLVLTVSAAGQAAAWRRVTLTALVAGRVAEVAARDDASVRAGSILVRMDAVDLGLAVRQARATRAQAYTQYRDAIASDDRLADAAVRAVRDSAARARAGLAAADVNVERAELDRLRADLLAPFDGRVASVRVVAGQWVRAGDELLTLVELDPLRVEVPVLESDVGALARGAAAMVTFAAAPQSRFDAVVESINPLVDPESRTALVTLRMRNSAGRILPGMYARAELRTTTLDDRVLLPRSAVLERDGRSMVFVYASTGDVGYAKWRYVTTGAGNDSLVEIVAGAEGEGVRAGELVLVEGHETLVHDALVRAVDAARPLHADAPRSARERR